MNYFKQYQGDPLDSFKNIRKPLPLEQIGPGQLSFGREIPIIIVTPTRSFSFPSCKYCEQNN
jgi:hypothetical protein